MTAEACDSVWLWIISLGLGEQTDGSWHSVGFFLKSGRKVRRQEDVPLYRSV